MTDIISIGIYPISTPIHGGQRRVRSLVDALRNDGLNVEYIPIFPAQGYPEHTEAEAEFSYGEELQIQMGRAGKRQDVDAGYLFDLDPGLRDRLIEKIVASKPRVLIFEHPWHAELLDYLDDRLKDVSVVYSSHNVESDLLSGFADRRRAQQLENRLVAGSDVVIACTEKDSRRYVKDGARKVVVFGNGHNVRNASDNLKRAWHHELRYRKIALFTGSAHPPNAEGFFRMFLPVPGCIGPDSKLVVVGGVSHLIQNDRRFHDNHQALARTTLQVGVQSDEGLDALFGIASVILLPIVSGGGSNLKTAEALLSLKPIVGTSKSFVGFEKFRELPGIKIADDPAGFKRAVFDVLTSNTQPNVRDAEDVKELTWSNILRQFPAVFRPLLQNGQAPRKERTNV